MGGYITAFKRAIGSFGKNKCATFSAAIAYYTVFSLFPLALLGVSLLGFFVGDDSARQSVVNGIAGVITLGDAGESALADTLAGIDRSKGWLGLIGIATAAWGASGLMGGIRSALDQVWDVDRPLPMLRAKFRDLWLLLSFGLLLALSTTSTGFMQSARDKGSDAIGPLAETAAPVFALVVLLVPFLLTLGAFLMLYKFGPHARLSFKNVLPAAIMTALFFEFGKNLLARFILTMGNRNALAGSLGAAVLFLAFVYYASQVILFAAEFAKHRMLITSGTLPASDPKPKKPKVPLGEKIKGTIMRLWKVDERHHDRELPYEPSRLDPDTNKPNNTREEVLFKQKEAAVQAHQDNAEVTGGSPELGVPVASGAGFVVGEAVSSEDGIGIRSAGRTRPLLAVSAARVTRDGKDAKLKDVQAGDRLTVLTNDHGQVVRIDASAPVVVEAEGQEPTANPAPALAAMLPVLGMVRSWQKKRSEKEKEQQPEDDGRHSHPTHARLDTEHARRDAQARRERVHQRRLKQKSR